MRDNLQYNIIKVIIANKAKQKLKDADKVPTYNVKKLTHFLNLLI